MPVLRNIPVRTGPYLRAGRFTGVWLLLLLSACATRYTSAAAYLEARQQLIRQDSLQSFAAELSLSAEEQSLNRKLLALQQQMIRQYDSAHFFPPARYFPKWQTHMHSTRLYGLLKQMPKGGIHHLHPTAGLDFRWVINRAVAEPGCYVYWREGSDQYTRGQMHFYRPGDVPAGFYPARQLHDSIPGFREQLYRLLTFDETIDNDSVSIWGEFNLRFQRISGFMLYQPVFRDFYVALFDSLAADGVQHVELREFMGGSLYDLKNAPGAFPYDSIITYLQSAAQEIRQTRDPDFSVKLIYTNLRFQPLDVIKRDLAKAFEVRAKYPELVKAYDLVAHEDAGNPTLFHLEAWLTRDSLARVYGVDLPLCLHDGESNWAHNTNLYDAVLLNSTRIGHGFNLSFFPAVEAIVRQRNICIEVNPLSNQLLGYIRDLRNHPAHSWIRRGIQISISPDDPAIYQYTGVTPDYWSIFLAWELDLPALKKLSMNAILYSHLNEAEKEKALRVWTERWNRFVADANRAL
jgi:adenosine deaminase CECR1